MGTPQAREGSWALTEPPGKSPGQATAAPVAGPGSCHGAWSCSPGPRFTTGDCLLRTPRTGGRRFLHAEGGSNSGGLRSKRSHSLLGWFSTDFRQLKLPSPSLQPRGRVGSFPPKGDSWLLRQSAGLTPHERTLSGRGSHLPRPTPPGVEPRLAPRAGLGSLVLPWAFCLCRGGRPTGKCGPRENVRSSG